MIRNSKTYNTQGRNKDGTHVERSENVGSVKIARITGARSGPTWSRITIINYVHHFNATFENSKKKNVHSLLLLSLLFPARRDWFQVIEHVRAFIETFVTLMGNAIRHVTR